MDKYINENELIIDFGFSYSDIMPTRDELISLIKRQPAADVAKVVLCKNCKHHYWEQEPCHGRTEHFCKYLNAEVDKYFYCAYGTRE